MKDSLEADLCSVVMDQTCFYKLIVMVTFLYFHVVTESSLFKVSDLIRTANEEIRSFNQWSLKRG